jgi:hypothetical protein
MLAVRRVSLLALTVALILSFVPVATADAKSRAVDLPEPENEPEELLLEGAEPAPRDVGAMGLTTNPYGCIGRSDNPHKSYTNPSEVHAKGITTCSYQVRRAYVHAQLYYQGAGGQWYEANGPDSSCRDCWTTSRVATSRCRNITWRLRS